MPALNIDKLHSVTVENNRFLVKLMSDNTQYSFTLSPSDAALLVTAIQSESNNLPETEEKTMIHSMGIQPIVGPGMSPGIEIKLSENLFLAILLGDGGLVALRTCIDQLESGISPSGGVH